MAESYEGVLASIPGLGGYNAQVAQNNARTGQMVQQMSGLATLKQQMDKRREEALVKQTMAGPDPLDVKIQKLQQLGPAGVQAAQSLYQMSEHASKASKLARTDAFYHPDNIKQYMAGDQLDLNRMVHGAAAVGAIDPEKLYSHIDGNRTKGLQAQATRESGMQRLQQQASQFERTHQLRLANAASNEEMDALKVEKDNFYMQLAQEKGALDRSVAEFNQGRAINEDARSSGASAYNYGTSQTPVLRPTIPQRNAPPPQAVPSGLAALQPGEPQPGPGESVSNMGFNVPTDVLNQFRSGQPVSSGTPPSGFIPKGVDVTQMQPGGAPAAPPPPVPQAAPPAPQSGAMPQVYGSPRMQDETRNRIVVANAKPGVGARPLTSIAKLNSDLKNGNITQEQYDTEIKRTSATFSPQALEFTAKQYLAGDRQAAAGYARNSVARVALQNAIVDEAVKQGKNPAEVAAGFAEFAGITAGFRTAGVRGAQIEIAASEAKEMISIVKETSDEFARTKFVPWNFALKHWESNTGEPEVKAFGAAINSLVNVYARAINPSGVPTKSDKDHAREMLSVINAPEQVAAVLGIMERELAAAQRAPGSVRKSLRGAITGGAPSAGPSIEDRLQKYK